MAEEQQVNIVALYGAKQIENDVLRGRVRELEAEVAALRQLAEKSIDVAQSAANAARKSEKARKKAASKAKRP